MRDVGSTSALRSRRAVSTAVLACLAVGGLGGVASAAEPRSVAGQLQAARAPVGELERSGVHELRDGVRVVRFEQEVAGLPVLDSEAVIVDSEGEPADLVADATLKHVDPPPPARVGRAAATRLAIQAAGVSDLAGAPRLELALDGDRGSLVWRVLFSSEAPTGAFEVLVDARSGRVVASREISQAAIGEARVFRPNPVVTNGGLGSLADNRDADYGELNSLRRNVTLRAIKRGQRCLVGSWVRATVRSSDVCRARRDFRSITRAPDAFEAVMAYFHVHQTQIYIQSLDFEDGINERRQRVRVNQFAADNSYYDPVNREIRMGRGGVDDGEDADVIVHEYGHAVQDDQAPGFGYTVGGGAVGEGFGDYLAAVMSSRAPGGNSGMFDVCIFDWDSVSYSSSGCGRTVASPDGLDDLSTGCFEEVHCRGEVWSSALWKLRMQLGVDAEGYDVVDSLVFGSNFLLDSDDEETDAALKLIRLDEHLYPSGTTDSDGTAHGLHEDAIRAEMEARDIL